MRTTSTICLVTLLFCALFAGTAFASEKLVIGGDEWIPYVHTEDGETTGIFMQFFEELSERTGIAIEVAMYPRQRMWHMISEGKLDGEVFIDPRWRAAYAEESVYTIPIMECGNLVLMKRERAIPVESPEDLAGKTVACVLGYRYAEGFSEAFEAGIVTRDDSPRVDAVPQKLAHDRVDAAILEEMAAAYMFAKYNVPLEEYVAVYTFQKSPFSLRLRKEHEPLLPRLNEAIEAMIADGTVDEILREYRMEE